MMFFIPQNPVLHPETREEILDCRTAYCLPYIEELCRETGMDYVRGELCTIEVARMYRVAGRITGFKVPKE